ncbi:hypothetical protein [Fictibacillus sp. NRS-1165]
MADSAKDMDMADAALIEMAVRLTALIKAKTEQIQQRQAFNE